MKFCQCIPIWKVSCLNIQPNHVTAIVVLCRSRLLNVGGAQSLIEDPEIWPTFPNRLVPRPQVHPRLQALWNKLDSDLFHWSYIEFTQSYIRCHRYICRITPCSLFTLAITIRSVHLSLVLGLQFLHLKSLLARDRLNSTMAVKCETQWILSRATSVDSYLQYYNTTYNARLLSHIHTIITVIF